MPRQELKSLFCEQLRCPFERYEELAFRQCLPWHARLLAPLVRTLSPHFFTEDFRFIHYLGAATGWREVNSEVISFQDVNHAKRGFLRTNLRIRVSGRKASALAERVFSAARQKRPAESG